ncbi:MAG: RND family efflux transporter MFP subunit [Gammaproteobacteria bacterium]|jgi:RND family efflux transporter MFP subunit
MFPRFFFLLIFLFFWGTSHAVQLSGSTEFADRIHLTIPQKGVVSKVYVSIGDMVQKGDLLLELDPTPFEAERAHYSALAQALKPVIDRLQAEFDKAQELYDRDTLARVDLDNSEIDLKIAQSRYEAALASSDLASYYLQSAQLFAPLSGRVLTLNSHVGAFVNPDIDISPLIEMADLQQMVAMAKIGSDIWTPDLVDQPAVVTYLRQTFSGKVLSISFERSSQSGEVPAFDLKVIFTANGKIPANMPVTIELQD